MDKETKQKIILDNVSWTVRAGEKWLLQGRNGSGKSTLLSLVCGDNPQADVEGSFAVGIYPVWYDSSIECPYRDKERETVPSCDMLRIREWSEMTGLLELL